MAKITPEIHKKRLPKGFQYPLHYSDLESALGAHARTDFFVSVTFWDSQAKDKEERRRLSEEGRLHVLEIRSDPDSPAVREPRPVRPWHEARNPVVLFVSVFAAPHEVSAGSGLHRDTLRELASEEVSRVVQGGRFASRWRLAVDLLADEECLEGVLETWTGLRQEPERRFRRPLREPLPAGSATEADQGEGTCKA